MSRIQWTCVLYLTSVALPLFAQAVNGSLLGSVTDSSGAVVPGAKVTIMEVNRGAVRATTTSEGGNYVFPDLTPGIYTITVAQQGFKQVTRENVDVLVNSSQRVDMSLPLGDVSELITVTAAAPSLQTDRADTGRKIETVQVATLPLGSQRNFQALLNLVPGTTRATFQHSQFFNAVSSLQTEVNGQMRMGNNYQIEGIDDNERTGLIQILVPPIEAIQTVDVSTSNFEAELGRASGAVTNVILKSGTNEFHGAAYEFNKVNALQARNFFDVSVGHTAYNYFGGAIGGPIKRNKLFFFGDYLRVTDHEANTNTLTIPTADFRAGNLTSSTTTIYDPATGNSDGTGRTAFSGNQIPASRINAISAKILALVPAPNLTGLTSNYFALLPFTKDTNSFDVKMDYNLSDNDRLSGRFSFSRPVVYQAPVFGMAGGPAQSAFEATGIQRTYSAGINYNRIFSPSLIAEFRVGVAHYHNTAHNSDYGTAAATNLGIPGVNLDAFTSGMVGISIGNYSSPMVGYSPSLPWDRAEANIDLVNTWTKTLGNHTIKWGGDLRRVRDDLMVGQTFSTRGLYTFGEAQTSIASAKTGFGNDFASFLLDLPSSVGRDLDTYYPAYRAYQLFAFAQDKWAATQKLTVDIGLRWEFYPPATPRFSGGFSNYDPTNNTLVIAGVGGNPKDLGMVKRYKNFAPRLGTAYRMTPSTVLRAGFGISYTPFPDNNYAYNYPIRQNNSYSPSGTGYGPALLSDGTPATFQAGFPAPSNAVVPSNGIITNPDKAVVYYVVNLGFKNPYVESWNLAIQQSLPKHFTLDIAYVGNHGVESVAAVNLNASRTIGAGTAGQPEYASFNRTAATNLLWQGFSTHYNALQMKLDRRFTNGLAITTAYTWGKGMSIQTGDDGSLMFYINPERNYARTDFDRTQTFVQSYVYDLPFGHGRRWLRSGAPAYILGDWRTSGILTLMTGVPLSITYSSSALLAPGNSQTPDLVAPVQIPHGIGTTRPWFSQSSFAAPAALMFGNLGRNPISGPGFFDLDLSLFKNIQLTERFNVELRAETFGFTNTPQFSNPGTTLGSANFGYVTGATGGRVIQLGAKVTF